MPWTLEHSLHQIFFHLIIRIIVRLNERFEMKARLDTNTITDNEEAKMLLDKSSYQWIPCVA